MKSVLKGLTLAASMLCISAAAAQPVVPAPHASHRVDLDSDVGVYSEWETSDLSGISALHGKVTIGRLGQDKRWLPAFQIWVGRPGNLARIKFSSADRKTVDLTVSRYSEKADSTLQPGGKVPLDVPVLVDVDWTGDGLITIRVQVEGQAAQRFKVALDEAPTLVRVVSSTGQIKVDPLVLGTRPAF